MALLQGLLYFKQEKTAKQTLSYDSVWEQNVCEVLSGELE